MVELEGLRWSALLHFYIAALLLTHPLAGLSYLPALATENLKSFPHESPQGCSFDSYYEYFVWEFGQQKHPTPKKKRDYAFSLLNEYYKKHPSAPSTVLDLISIKDLNLVNGPPSDGNSYLAHHIDRTRTELGRALLVQLIAQPTTDLQELHKRQAIIKELVNNQELFDAVDALLMQAAKTENLVLSFWQEGDCFKSKLDRRKYFPWPNLNNKLKKNVWFMEFTERLHIMQDSLLLGAQFAGTCLLPLAAAALLLERYTDAHFIKKIAKDQCGVTTVASFFSVFGFVTWIIDKLVATTVTDAGKSFAAGVNYGTSTSYQFDNLKGNLFSIKAMHSKLKHMTRTIQATQQLQHLMKKNDVLHKHVTVHQLSRSGKHDVQTMLHCLASPLFKEKVNVFSRLGVILAAYCLVCECKEHLIDDLVALAFMDFYMSAARLYKEGQHVHTSWCFAEFIEQSPTPFVKAQHFWNPFLHADGAVSNSIAIGTDGNPRTLIITGPNAGGKSTAIKAIIECCILGQSLGICPATSCSFTPFANIITYLNITDDIAAGKSHFKAGVARAQDLMTMLDNLASGEFSLAAIDELFNGTSYAEGQAAAYCLIELMGNHPQTINVTATHFPRVTSLEEKTNGNLFRNYKVSVAFDAQRTIVYPFKLEPGIAQQHIALDILEQEGFGAAFVQRARELLQDANVH